MKGFCITLNDRDIARKIRRGTCGKGKGGIFAFSDKSKYNRKIKFKKAVE